MRLKQVSYFLAVADTLNFTRAAEKCRVSQPALSRAVQDLEFELGGPLVHRAGHATRLTPLGKLVLPAMKKIASGELEAKQLALESAKCTSSQLRIAVSPLLSQTILSNLLVTFKQHWPEIGLLVTQAPLPRLPHMLLSGAIDVSIAAGDTLDAMWSDRFKLLKIAREPILVVLGSSHRLAHKVVVETSDLVGEPLFELGPAVISSELSQVPATQCDSLETLLALVQAGVGYALLPQSITIRTGLVGRQLKGSNCRCCETGVITVRGQRYSAPLARFMRLIEHAQPSGIIRKPDIARKGLPSDRTVAERGSAAS